MSGPYEADQGGVLDEGGSGRSHMRAELGVLEGFSFNMWVSLGPLQHTDDFREPRTSGLSQSVRTTGKPLSIWFPLMSRLGLTAS